MTKRILIVEDSAPTRDIIRHLVNGLGYETAEAVDGDDAIEAIKNGGVDGILLDLLMPNRDGIEVLVWLKAERPEIPVVVLTQAGGGRGISYPEIAERFGALKAFHKPVTKDNVHEALELLAEAWDPAKP